MVQKKNYNFQTRLNAFTDHSKTLKKLLRGETGTSTYASTKNTSITTLPISQECSKIRSVKYLLNLCNWLTKKQLESSQEC